MGRTKKCPTHLLHHLFIILLSVYRYFYILSIYRHYVHAIRWSNNLAVRALCHYSTRHVIELDGRLAVSYDVMSAYTQFVCSSIYNLLHFCNYDIAIGLNRATKIFVVLVDFLLCQLTIAIIRIFI